MLLLLRAQWRIALGWMTAPRMSADSQRLISMTFGCTMASDFKEFAGPLTLAQLNATMEPMHEIGVMVEARMKEARMLYASALVRHASSMALLLADQASGKRIRSRRVRAINAQGMELNRLQRELFDASFHVELFGLRHE